MRVCLVGICSMIQLNNDTSREYESTKSYNLDITQVMKNDYRIYAML